MTHSDDSSSDGSNRSVPRWMRQSTTFKLICIGILALVLTYPVGLVDDLVSERQKARGKVVHEISQKWGNHQTLVGPILTIPVDVRKQVQEGDETKVTTERIRAHFLPDELEVDGALTSKTRYRSIYEVLLYTSEMSFRGSFAPPNFANWDRGDENIRWDLAYISFGISDLTGIRDPIELTFDGSTYEFQPSVPTDDVLSSGVSVPVDLAGGDEIATAGADDPYAFEFDVRLNGRKSLNVVPVGKSTDVHLEADTGSPSFTGQFLPDRRTIDQDQFTADWNVLALNRDFPQQWLGDAHAIESKSFGVELMAPVDHYRKAERSTKYSLLFIVLTFAVFFFAEVLRRTRVHPIQYTMVGAGLCLFFLLLLALSEHLGFDTAYLLASVGVIGLVTGYSTSILGDAAPTAIIGASLVALYIFLFTVLQLEMYALLIGSLGLFAVLALVMFLSRHVDWYRTMSRDGDV